MSWLSENYITLDCRNQPLWLRLVGALPATIAEPF